MHHPTPTRSRRQRRWFLPRPLVLLVSLAAALPAAPVSPLNVLLVTDNQKGVTGSEVRSLKEGWDG